MASGSIPLSPPFAVKGNTLLVPIEVALNGDSPAAKKTLVVGGGATGCELALHLSETGSTVTVLEMLPTGTIPLFL